MGFLVNAIAGDRVKSDHTQFGTLPIADRPPSPDTRWPQDFTLDEMMKLCWRVRRWKFEGTVDFEYEDNFNTITKHLAYNESVAEPNPPSPFVFADRFATHRYSGGICPDERYLAVSKGLKAPYFAIADVTPITPDLKGTFSGLHTQSPAAQLVPPATYWDPVGPKFYPLIIFIVTIGNFVSGSTVSPQFVFTSILAETPGHVGANSGALTILGHDIPVYMGSNMSGYSNDGHFNSVAIDFEMTPVGDSESYWSYANSEGDPVWDSTNGNQLVSPFS